MVSLCRPMCKAWSIAQCSCKRTNPVIWVCYFVERWGDSKANNDKENCGLFRRFTGFVFGKTDDPSIKKAPGINAEGFVPTMKDWEEQAENWTDDQILQAMQKLVEIQQRRHRDGR